MCDQITFLVTKIYYENDEDEDNFEDDDEYESFSFERDNQTLMMAYLQDKYYALLNMSHFINDSDDNDNNNSNNKNNNNNSNKNNNNKIRLSCPSPDMVSPLKSQVWVNSLQSLFGFINKILVSHPDISAGIKLNIS